IDYDSSWFLFKKKYFKMFPMALKVIFKTGEDVLCSIIGEDVLCSIIGEDVLIQLLDGSPIQFCPAVPHVLL
ncbi:hypothetical protein DKP78_21235, partial [Enterococcus faecium]